VSAAAADPFDTLGVEPRFDLDEARLAQRHRDLSRALHPDRHAGAAATSRRLALGRMIEVNEALRVLRDPVRRAGALARRLGLPVGEGQEPKASPALLMDFMDAREELGAAVAAKDAAAVAALATGMRDREAKVTSALAEAFADPGDLSDARRRDAILALLGELRYVRRFLDEVAAFEETLL
jgi:molecular chaperone HscB